MNVAWSSISTSTTAQATCRASTRLESARATTSALSVSKIVIAACERARKFGLADEWLPATLLSAAFDSGDVDKAEELAADVAAEGAARWKLDSLLGDLKASVAQVEDKDRRDQLAAILKGLAPNAAV
jgi:hypothetical protein